MKPWLRKGLVAVEREDRKDAYQRLSIRPYALLTKASVLRIGETLDAEQVIYGQFDLKAPVDTSFEVARLAADHNLCSGPEAHEAGSGIW